MKHTTFLAASATAAFFATGAIAAPVDIEVIQAAWQNHVGGTNVSYDPAEGVLTAGQVDVHWGVPFPGSVTPNPLNPDQRQSGYSFITAGTPFPATAGTPFSLGTFVHENWEIFNGGSIQSVELAFLFGGSPQGTPDPLRPAATFPAVFSFSHNETPNNPSDCEEDDVACNDIVMVTAIDGDTERVRVGNLVYTFTLLGFGDTAAEAVGAGARVFSTEEGRSNRTQLWAEYTVAPIPLPAAGWLLLGGLGALGVAARRRRKDA